MDRAFVHEREGDGSRVEDLNVFESAGCIRTAKNEAVKSFEISIEQEDSQCLFVGNIVRQEDEEATLFQSILPFENCALDDLGDLLGF